MVRVRVELKALRQDIHPDAGAVDRTWEGVVPGGIDSWLRDCGEDGCSSLVDFGGMSCRCGVVDQTYHKNFPFGFCHQR